MAYSSIWDKDKLVAYGAGFMYYIEKHKLLDIMSALLAEIVCVHVDDPRKWLGENILRIASRLYIRTLDDFHRGVQTERFELPRRFLYRIAIFGMLGSGRHSLAESLSKRFDLVYIDADTLLYHTINPINQEKQTEESIELQKALEQNNVYAKSKAAGEIIEKRLLMDDALRHGWVLVNYPNNACEARVLFENMTAPPNRFVYLQCAERMAQQRTVTKPLGGSPQHNFTYFERAQEQYRRSQPALNEYLGRRREVIYIDASPCFQEVRSNVLTEISRTPYLLGFSFGADK